MKNLILLIAIILIIPVKASKLGELLLVCAELNQVDLKELTIIKKSTESDIIHLYFKNNENKYLIQESSIKSFQNGIIKIPNYLGLPRYLVKEDKFWSIKQFTKFTLETIPTECIGKDYYRQ